MNKLLLSLILALSTQVALAAPSTGTDAARNGSTDTSRGIDNKDTATVQQSKGNRNNSTVGRSKAKSTTDADTVGKQHANTNSTTDSSGLQGTGSLDASAILLGLFAKLEQGGAIGDANVSSAYFEQCKYMQQKPLTYVRMTCAWESADYVKPIVDKGVCGLAYGLVAKETFKLAAKVAPTGNNAAAVLESSLATVLTDSALMTELGATVKRSHCLEIRDKNSEIKEWNDKAGSCQSYQGIYKPSSVTTTNPVTVLAIQCETPIGLMHIDPKTWSADIEGMQVFGKGSSFIGVGYNQATTAGTQVASAASDSDTTGNTLTKAKVDTNSTSVSADAYSDKSKAVSKAKTKSTGISVKNSTSRSAKSGVTASPSP